MFTSAFMFYCSNSAGAKFGFGEVEKGDSKRDWFSWTTPCCEVLKCNSGCCTCILCCPVKYNPNLAFLSVLEKFWVLSDRWRCANAWCDSILDVADGSDALGQQQLRQPVGSQAFAAFLAPGSPKQQELILWEMQQWERENHWEQELYWGEGGAVDGPGVQHPGSSVKPSNS